MADLQTIGTLVGSDIKKLRDEDQLQNEANFNAYGLTERVDGRYLENDTPNIIIDQIGDSVRLSDGMVERLGDELVANGDFSDGANGWVLGAGWSVSDGEAYSSGVDSSTLRSTTNHDQTKMFQITINVTSLAQGELKVWVGGVTRLVIDKIGVYEFISEGGNAGFLDMQTSYSFIGSVDNVNMRELPQATMPLAPFDPVSTDEIIATANTTITQVNHAKGDIVVTEDGDNVYQATEDTTAGEDTTGAKFQVIADVTRQDVIAISKSGYKTYKGLAFHDELVSADDIATSQGFSKLASGLYSDGVDDVTIVGLRSTLNSGAYHPVHNSFGTAYWSQPTHINRSVWWHNPELPLSKYTSFLNKATQGNATGAIGTTVSGEGWSRPDARFYDKVYADGYGGVIPVATYTDSDIDLDVEATKLLSAGGLERGVETVPSFNQIVTGDNAVTYAYYNEDINFEVVSQYLNKKLPILLADGSFINPLVVALVDDGITNNRAVITTDASHDRGGAIQLYTVSANHLLSYNSKLSIDVIGDPANYPQDWLNHLAGGKSINFNPLLVGEEGEDYVPPVSDATIQYKFSDKNNELKELLRLESGSWASEDVTAAVIDYIKNIVDHYMKVDRVRIDSYTSQNKPLAESTPLPVIKVLPKAIAQNSYSIYKGAMVTNAITGKIAVGDSANGLESRMLENAEIGVLLVAIPSVPITVKAGNIIGIGAGFDDASLEGTCKYVVQDLTAFAPGVAETFSDSGYWLASSGIQTTPSHNTITLNADVSPASKWFVSEVELTNGEIGVGVFGEDISTDKSVTTFTDLSVINVKRTGVFK